MAADLSNVLREISGWSSYELFRLMSAIGHRLEDSERILLIKRHLKIGQKVNYYVPEQDREIKAVIVKFMRNRALVEDAETGQKWNVPYCAIDVDHTGRHSHSQFVKTIQANKFVPAAAREIKKLTEGAVKPKPPLFAVGDDVVFLDRHQNQTQGKVVDLHDRTATISCKGSSWRIAYEDLTKLGAVHKNNIKGDQPLEELVAIDHE